MRLDEIGDSVVVSTAEDVCHVHVHTDDIGAALEAGIEHGVPRRVAVTLLETIAPAPKGGLSIVACAAGPGIAALLEEAGATTVASGPGHRASAGELVAAVREEVEADPLTHARDAAKRWQATVLLKGARTVVVAGEVQRGKSSLVNALVGYRDLCPVGVDVTSSVAVSVTTTGDLPAAHAAELFFPSGPRPWIMISPPGSNPNCSAKARSRSFG